MPGAPGTWSIRMTPTLGGPAGTMVKSGDQDVQAFSTKVAKVALSLVQRDDKAYYLVPAAAGGLKKFTPIPVNSIRVSDLTVKQPDVQPTTVTVVGGATVQAGQTASVSVVFTNLGGMASPGVLATRIGGRLVDARVTPWVNPGESGNALVTFTVPNDLSGSTAIEVNNAFTPVSVTPAPAVPAGVDPQVTALQDQVAALQARVAGLETAAPTGVATASAGTPSIHNGFAGDMPTVLAVAAFAGVLLAIRRRNA